MQFKAFSALFAVVLPIVIVVATPLPGGDAPTSVCSSGGDLKCCNGGLLNCVASDTCNAGDVYCCFNDNTQFGIPNGDKGNCKKVDIEGAGEGDVVTGLLSGVLGLLGGGAL